MRLFDPVCIERIEHPQHLRAWIPPIMALIAPWLPVLQTDGQESLAEQEILFRNLSEELPHLWIAYNQAQDVIASASLSQVIPGRYAYIHGVRALSYRKHPVVRQLSRVVLDEAFIGLQLQKLKAEFEADNRGALGFCRLYGFTKEAHFKDDVLIQRQPKDVVIYSLFRATYFQHIQNHRRL